VHHTKNPSCFLPLVSSTHSGQHSFPFGMSSPRVRAGTLAVVAAIGFILLSLYYFGIFDSGASVANRCVAVHGIVLMAIFRFGFAAAWPCFIVLRFGWTLQWNNLCEWVVQVVHIVVANPATSVSCVAEGWCTKFDGGFGCQIGADTVCFRQCCYNDTIVCSLANRSAPWRFVLQSAAVGWRSCDWLECCGRREGACAHGSYHWKHAKVIIS
jgi:hypothetical protein